MAATSASAGVVEVLVSFYRCGEENAFERHRSRIPIGKEQRNITDAKKHLINFLGISQMATSLGIGNCPAGRECPRENEEFTYPYATSMGNGSSTPCFWRNPDWTQWWLDNWSFKFISKVQEKKLQLLMYTYGKKHSKMQGTFALLTV